MAIADIRTRGDMRGRRVLLRASLNVPIVDGQVRSNFRLKRTLDTIRYLKEAGAVTLILGHIGRDPALSLLPVFEYLQSLLPVTFVATPDQLPALTSEVTDGSIFLLENLRRFPGEVANDPAFAASLAAHGEVFVSDAFSDAHRKHASIVSLPQLLPSYAGFLLSDEIAHLGEALTPPHPALFILGGAKFETKAPLIRKFLDSYDTVFVGGALAHDIFKAKGFSIGRSVSSDVPLELSDILAHPNLILPVDVVVVGVDGSPIVKSPEHVGEEETILDAGPETLRQLLELSAQQKFVLWNGPLGNYERGYKGQTEALALGLTQVSASCVVGGGDTVASIDSLNLGDKYAFVSTGGGAMLEYLQQGTLPGIEALTS